MFATPGMAMPLATSVATSAAALQDAAIAGSGAANAAYFAARAWRGTGARRLAAAVLLLTFAGLALDGALHLAAPATAAASPMAGALLRLPTLAGSLAASALIAIGVGR